MRPRSLAFAGVMLLGACTANTGVKTTPTFVAAVRTPGPAELVPQEETAPAAERAPSSSGARAVHQAMRDVTIQPTDLDMQGNTWVIEDVDQRAVYSVPTAPLAPTTILLPPNEGLTAAVSGSTDDFTIGTATVGNRAAITVMPNCANPKTERFGADSETPLVPCMAVQAKATFLTTAGAYHFVFPVHDWTAVAQVEVNHAPPPPTNQDPAGRPPFPSGSADPLFIEETGAWRAQWAPVYAYADPEKTVIQFRKPLPVLPGLYAGMEGEQLVNYSTVETPDAVYFVTDRRVTEAELRIDEEILTLTSGRRDELRREPRRFTPRSSGAGTVSQAGTGGG